MRASCQWRPRRGGSSAGSEERLNVEAYTEPIIDKIKCNQTSKRDDAYVFETRQKKRPREKKQ